ncbi:hypothetical protein SmJEL517_g03934 [Synchytrium microbalum]|uniref:Amino acid transporter transmembrane domain-containing protein n=1 Tax=Synchytrium microbalum TaxID=1806994 RepID=A0A507C113_9FUNG|nr:uncharacterized protein SmJEL517_g03934 [Synchytrium microbalum]TPX33111.1 hypothetical protein SmJEL517_g03934 [Synchytrium microbalum]
MSDDYKKNIGITGSISLLVSSMTGPGIVTIPLIFQTGGWVVPLLTFLVMMVLTGMGSLCLVEAMSKFPGNRNFEQNVEYTVLVHQFYGRNWYYLTHLVIYGSMQSINIASIIVSIQTLDSFLITVFGATCGFQIAPQQGILCVSTQSGSNSPFDGNTMLMTAGFLLLIALVAPMAAMKLSDNMIIQFVSFCFLVFCLTEWTILSWSIGANPSYLPAFGASPASVIGTVVFNYAFVTTVPSWINSKHPNVSITKCIWISLACATFGYIVFGVFGALALIVPQGSNFMVTIQTSAYASPLQSIIFVAFPILALLTSIPVYIIISRMNLIQSKLCTPGLATFWAAIFPFLVVIPFQTGTLINTFINWTALIFQSVTNFIAPFLIYLFLEKRNMVLAQSVIDELDAMDFMGGEKRKRGGDDDDFDYVYHLPHANPDIIVRRDPFSYYLKQNQNDGMFVDIDSPFGGNGTTSAPNISASANAIVPGFNLPMVTAPAMTLTPGAGTGLMATMLSSLAASNSPMLGGSMMRLDASNKSSTNLRQPSALRLDNLGPKHSVQNMHRHNTGDLDSTASRNSFAPEGSQLSLTRSRPRGLDALTNGDQPTLRQRLANASSMLGDNKSRAGSLAGSRLGSRATGLDHNRGKTALAGAEAALFGSIPDANAAYLEEKVTEGLAAQDLINNDLNAFRAYPQWITDVVPAKVLVAFAFCLTVCIVVGVIIYDFEQLAVGKSPF